MIISQDEVKKILLDDMILNITGIKPPPARPVRNVPKVNYDESAISPRSQMLLNLLTPVSRARLRMDFMKDDKEVMRMEEDEEDNDPLYKYFESTEIGVYMEFWICYNLRCPCGGKFMKYLNVNKPIVDVRCVNPEHKIEHGPKYYQIKTTLSGSTYNGYKYFSDKYIFVGSKNKGYYAHYLKPSDNLETLIGYICIEYNKINDIQIKLNLAKSFIVVPDMMSKIDEYYYTYIILSGNNAIQYNTKMCNIYNFNQILDNININITTTQQYDTIIYKKEDRDIAMKLFNKYYKYKQKYLQLKNNIL